MLIKKYLEYRYSLTMLCFGMLLAGCQQLELTADTRRECPYNGAINRSSGQNFDPGAIARPSLIPIVKVIEFTDNGELHDRCQWSDLLYEVRGGIDLAAAKERSKFVVIYVHGWKHDAAAADSDFIAFSDWIDKLSKKSSKNTDVIGLYVSWPGKSLNIPGIDNLTFWSRKGAADRVSTAAYFSKLLSTIESIRRQRGNADDFTVGIGHSFGARILYTAVSPLLLHELQTHHPGSNGKYGKFTGVLDLTVLLNPAFQATRFTAIDSARRWQEQFHRDQQPLLLSVSTDNDWPNQYFFPIGQIVGTRLSEREITTLGNYKPYVTHRLEPSDVPVPSGGTWYDHFCSHKICLRRSGNDVQPGNPFLISTTGPDVIDGHNGIWPEDSGSDRLKNWLMDFVLKIKENRAIQAQR